MDVIVKCGNGGDWEWYNDQSIWDMWIIKNVTKTGFSTGTDGCRADQLCIRFENPHHATIFCLKRPFYVTWKDIKINKQ